MQPRCLPPRDAAAYCGVPRSTLEKHGPSPVKLGRHRVYEVRALDAWVDQQAGSINVNATLDDEAKALAALGVKG